MGLFEEDLEDSWFELESDPENALIDEMICSCETDDIEELITELREELELDPDDFSYFEESVRRRVSADGSVSKVKSKRVRSRNATRTTGMSKSELRRRAKKAARTRKRSGQKTKAANKKRAKAMKKRKQRGIQQGT